MMKIAVLFASLLGAHADIAALKTCLRGKLMTAMSSCQGPFCTPACKGALTRAVSSMDGSCCSEVPPNVQPQCINMITQQLVPKLREVIAQKCPAMEFELMLNGMHVDELFSEANLMEEPKSTLAMQGSQNYAFVPTVLVAAMGGIVGAVSMFVFLSHRKKIGVPEGMLG